MSDIQSIHARQILDSRGTPTIEVDPRLKDGTIDCIATDHAPHNIEEKENDFIHASCGMIGLESAFGLSNTVLQSEGCSIEEIIWWFKHGQCRTVRVF